MAKIRALHIAGYKGQNVVEQLTGLDIFVGPNGAGKSARPEALSLATLGYIPGIPKKAEEIMKKCPGDEMSVGLTLDTGFSFLRTLTNNTSFDRTTGEEKVSTKETVSVTPSKGEKTETAKKARIAEEMGAVSIHLDFQEFEGLSPAKKREYLTGFVTNATRGWDKDAVEKYLKANILNDTMAETNPEAYKGAEQLISDALDCWIDGLSTDDGVLAMLEWAKTEQSVWNAKKKDAAGAVRQLADIKNQMVETDREIAENKNTLTKLRAELVEVAKEISSGQEIKKAFEARKTRIAELEGKIELLKEGVKPADTTDLDKQIAVLEAQIKEVDLNTTALEQQTVTSTAKKEAAEDELTKLKSEKAGEINEKTNLTRALETVGKAGGLCVISRLIKCPKDFTPFVEHVQAEVEKTDERIKELDAEILKQTAELDRAKDEIKKLEESRKAVFANARTIQNKNDELKNQIITLKDEKTARINEITLKQKEQKMYRDELEKLEKTPFEAVPDISVLELQSTGLTKSITDLATKVEAQEESRATLMNMQTSQLENKQAEYLWSAAKALVENLGPKGIQGELLKGGLEPLRGCIQANLEVLGIPYEFAFRTESNRGQEILEFGWIKHGNFVSFDSLSTGERLVVLLAVLTSLLQRGDTNVRALVIDEFQSLDAVRYQSTLKGLKVLHDTGKLDNILIAGVLPITKLDGWNVRVLGDEEAEVKASRQNSKEH